MNKITRFFTSSRLIALSFARLILLGGMLLSLPISSANGASTPFIDALFTSASASCVTGLTVRDTLTHWSLFGKVLILLLIQIGGIGCMTVISLMVRLFHGKLATRNETVLMQSVGVLNRKDVLTLFKNVILFTFSAEGVGAVLLSIRWIPQFGFVRGFFTACFTSVSAFCNAGFDLFGDLGIGSLSYHSNDIYTMLVISLLIICGGLGFIVWSDLFVTGLRLKKLQFHTKAVLLVTATLLATGTVFFFFSEQNVAMEGLSLPERWLSSFFQSVTTRTAGFYGFDQSSLSSAGVVGSIILMAIGGSPGSTAGGMKTTTVLVVLLAELSTARKNREIGIFRRRIDNETVRQANSIFVIYLSLIFLACGAICLIDPAFSLGEILFETVSAIATVGLSLGITAELSAASQAIIIGLMYIGRIGGLTFAFVLSEKQYHAPISRPTGQLLIG